MKRILVVQLCRLGDILQTTPMLRGLRRAHPEASITLMVLDGFGHAPVPGHLYDRLARFPFDAAAAALEPSRGDWQRALKLLKAFVAELGPEPFDLVLNLTNSATANLLCAVVPSREVRGGVIAADRTRVVRHPWMAYFWASLLARELGSLNLVDLFCRVAEVPLDGGRLEIDVPDGAAESMGRWLTARGWNGGPLLALQLGASDERKRWPPERFAETVDRLPQRAGTIVLVGSAGERPLGARTAAMLARPHLDAIGETTVAELAALLRRCRLLVTNDTGTMHIATAVGTPVVDLSTGPVFVHETGPYAVGSLAVEPTASCFPCAAGATCHHLACRDDFTPDDIAALVMFALEGGALPRPARARVLRAGRAAAGRLEFRPLWDPSGGTGEQLRQAFARMWDASLGFIPPLEAAAGDDAAIGLDGALHAPALEGFAARADRAARIAARAGSSGHEEAAVLSSRLQQALEHEMLTSTLQPMLRPLVGYLRTRLESQVERSVRAVAAAYQLEWRRAAERARTLAGILAARADAA